MSDRVVAEEIMQETWLAVLRGIDRSQARASLKKEMIPERPKAELLHAFRTWKRG